MYFKYWEDAKSTLKSIMRNILSGMTVTKRCIIFYQDKGGSDMIKSKADALEFLKAHKEFSDHDFIEGEFWFRYDGIKEPECLRHDYTINHETEGIIGVMEKEAIDYVFRNRKRLNKLQAVG